MKQDKLTLTPKVEFWAVVFLSLFAFTLRSIFWQNAITPPFAYEQVTPMTLQRYLDSNDKLEQIQSLLHITYVEYIDNSPILLPITALIQKLIGPNIHIPVLFGAFFGALEVYFAWLLGRALFGSVYGLSFAALICISPLQLMWARIGGYYISGVTFILLLLWSVWAAGQRVSIFLGFLCGVLTWCSFYFYYVARSGLALGPFLFALALFKVKSSWQKKCFSFVAYSFGFLLCYQQFSNIDAKHTFWPVLLSYVGYSGEQGTNDWLSSTWSNVHREIPRALSQYFLAYRSGLDWDSTVFGIGPERGGLCFLAVIPFGIFGFVSILREKSKSLIWYAMLVTGLGLSVLGITTPRRLLIFDVAWCGFAAYAMSQLIECLGRKSSPKTLFKISVTTIVFAGIYSLLTLAILTERLPKRLADIPFGQGWTNDGYTCRECLELGKQWQQDIESGAFVILFDTDVPREIPGAFGGLPTFGFQAALAAGKSDAFQEFYGVFGNLKTQALAEEYFPTNAGYEKYFEQIMNKTHSESLIWQFVRPTQWEKALIEKLQNKGGTVSEYKTELGPTPGIRVTTPASFPLFKETLQEMTGRGIGENESCIQIQEQPPIPAPLFALAIGSANGPLSNSWLLAGNGISRFGEQTFDTGLPGGAHVESTPQETIVRVLTRDGNEISQTVGNQGRQITKVKNIASVGIGCGQFLANTWWVVDPITGTLQSSEDTSWILKQKWTGIATKDPNLLILGSAEQEIYIYDVETKVLLTHFPAHVLPTRSIYFGECSLLAAGTDWIASLDNFRSLLHIYETNGKPLASMKLDQYFSIDRFRTVALASKDNVLALATQPIGDIRLMEIHPSHLQNCQAEPKEAQQQIYQRLDIKKILLGTVAGEILEQPAGPPKMNRSFDNGNLVCNRKLYTNGIGVHAPSVIRFPIEKQFSRIQGGACIPDAVTPDLPTSIIFEIWGDGKSLWQSDVVTPHTPVRTFDLDVQSVKELELRVSDGGNGALYDSGAWVGFTQRTNL